MRLCSSALLLHALITLCARKRRRRRCLHASCCVHAPAFQAPSAARKRRRRGTARPADAPCNGRRTELVMVAVCSTQALPSESTWHLRSRARVCPASQAQLSKTVCRCRTVTLSSSRKTRCSTARDRFRSVWCRHAW